ncbi:MAG: hypothetical protein ACE5JG_05320 [Planctomycetota bacterium]
MTLESILGRVQARRALGYALAALLLVSVALAWVATRQGPVPAPVYHEVEVIDLDLYHEVEVIDLDGEGPWPEAPGSQFGPAAEEMDGP